MLEALIPAGAGILGAAVGIGGTIWATHLQQRGEDRRALRPELRELVAGLWSDAEALWRAESELQTTIVDFMDSRRDPGVSPEYLDDLDRRRVEGIRQRFEAQRSADARLALVRIVRPELAQAASDLVNASSIYKLEKHLELNAERIARREAFIRAAHEVLRTA